MVLAHACGLSAVACVLAAVVHPSVNTVRQRLREWYQPATAKPGRGRTEVDPTTCCGPLVRWITGGWAERRVALALDVTNLGDRFHVLTAAVVYRGCAIPVAWAILPAGIKDPWNPHWGRLLDRVAAALGVGWTVLVLTDRGLESAELFRAITRRGWHPLMRVKAAGSFRPAGWHAFHALKSFAAREGTRFAATGTAYKTAPLACTLLACRVAGCADPWLVLTDLPPSAANPCWYALRSWIEQGFKVFKRGGWQWQRTRMTDPARAERLWVVLAVATLWLVEVGRVRAAGGDGAVVSDDGFAAVAPAVSDRAGADRGGVVAWRGSVRTVCPRTVAHPGPHPALVGERVHTVDLPLKGPLDAW